MENVVTYNSCDLCDYPYFCFLFWVVSGNPVNRPKSTPAAYLMLLLFNYGTNTGGNSSPATGIDNIILIMALVLMKLLVFTLVYADACWCYSCYYALCSCYSSYRFLCWCYFCYCVLWCAIRDSIFYNHIVELHVCLFPIVDVHVDACYGFDVDKAIIVLIPCIAALTRSYNCINNGI